MTKDTALSKWRLPITRATMLSVIKAFAFLLRVAPALCLGLILLTAVQGLLPGWNLTLLRSILAVALEPGSSLAAYFPEVAFLALVIIAVELLGPLAAVIQESLSDKTSTEMGYTLGRAFVEIPDLHFLESPDIRLQQALWLLITIFGTWVNITHGYEKIMEFLKADVSESGERPSELLPNQSEYDVVFENVYFRYPGSQQWALKDLSFNIKANECIALVGRNGSGKTTIVKLILGLYKPTKGRILFKRRERNSNDINRWQKTGVVFQDFCRFLLTLGENIEVGNAALVEEVRRERAVVAAEKAGLAELIQKLPGGLDTQMGKVFGGVEVSTGQWQRIALARALMKDSYIMLFDEPTSALDPLIEAQVYELFRELSIGSTTVLVSHRLNSVMMADRILVINDGVLVEQGTHEELVSQGGIYSRLYAAQSQSYLAGLSRNRL